MILKLYHDSTLEGGHPSARDTRAKVMEHVWWPSLESDVIKWVATCLTCKQVKPQLALTVEQRTRLADRPFRLLQADTIGPIEPPDNGYKYLAHVEDLFSRWCWVHPMKTASAKEWATFLVEYVYFDVAGFPAALKTDRGT